MDRVQCDKCVMNKVFKKAIEDLDRVIDDLDEVVGELQRLRIRAMEARTGFLFFKKGDVR